MMGIEGACSGFTFYSCSRNYLYRPSTPCVWHLVFPMCMRGWRKIGALTSHALREGTFQRSETIHRTTQRAWPGYLRWITQDATGRAPRQVVVSCHPTIRKMLDHRFFGEVRDVLWPCFRSVFGPLGTTWNTLRNYTHFTGRHTHDRQPSWRLGLLFDAS